MLVMKQALVSSRALLRHLSPNPPRRSLLMKILTTIPYLFTTLANFIKSKIGTGREHVVQMISRNLTC